MSETNSTQEYTNEVEELRLQLQEANDTIDAIRHGQVDALFVTSDNGPQIYTLKSADQTYRVFIEKMKEGAVTLNRSEIILYSNSQFATMLGKPLTKVIGIPFKEFIPPAFQSYYEELVNKGWESDSKGEIILQNESGAFIPFLLSLTSLELDEGDALSIILTDLSQQKEVEQELKLKNIQLEEVRHKIWAMNERLEETIEERTRDLQQSREHFKFLADNIPVIVWTADETGKSTYYNKQWFEYTGLQDSSKNQVTLTEMVHPDDRVATIKAWEQAITENKSFVFEFRLRNAVGEYKWHLGKANPLRDELGNVTSWFGTSTNIEEQKKELEKKDEFISVASHELKTPLTSLKGYLQLMELRKDLPADVTEHIIKANNSINKLQNLINDLLDVSKIQAGKLKFDTKLINLSDFVNDCCENSQLIYPDYTIIKKIQPNIFVNGNAERLEQVLMNQINNAVKYSPDKKEFIIQLLAADEKVTVSVTDQGTGILLQDQARIFERFFRAENTRFLASGLGMGLYISREIIKEHDGEMGVKSQPNAGTTIFFTIPISKEK